jgi:hypothetical protein
MRLPRWRSAGPMRLALRANPRPQRVLPDNQRSTDLRQRRTASALNFALNARRA